MVSGVGRDNLVVELTVRNHKIISGVLEKQGGKDEGPDSHELLEAALASCTALTVQMYAKYKGFKLKSTDVRVSIESEGAQTHIKRIISLHGDLTAAERERIFEISKRCPIHRLLESNVTIHSEME
jgi:putative redox protein